MKNQNIKFSKRPGFTDQKIVSHEKMSAATSEKIT